MALIFHLPQTAQAQAQGSLILTFTYGMVAVPISPWIVAFLAAILATVAMVLLRKQVPTRFGWLPVWSLGILGLAILVAGTRSGMLILDANAQPAPTPFPLFASPATIPYTHVPVAFEAINQTGRAITITDMAVTTCIAIVGLQTSCALGMTLQPSQACLVKLQPSFRPPCGPRRTRGTRRLALFEAAPSECQSAPAHGGIKWTREDAPTPLAEYFYVSRALSP